MGQVYRILILSFFVLAGADAAYATFETRHWRFSNGAELRYDLYDRGQGFVVYASPAGLETVLNPDGKLKQISVAADEPNVQRMRNWPFNPDTNTESIIPVAFDDYVSFVDSAGTVYRTQIPQRYVSLFMLVTYTGIRSKGDTYHVITVAYDENAGAEQTGLTLVFRQSDGAVLTVSSAFLLQHPIFYAGAVFFNEYQKVVNYESAFDDLAPAAVSSSVTEGNVTWIDFGCDAKLKSKQGSEGRNVKESADGANVVPFRQRAVQ